MSDPFITTDDLTLYLGTDASGDAGDFACAAACDIVREFLDSQVTIETDVVDRLDGTGTDALLLKRPVRLVSEVVECETTLTVVDDYWLGSAGILYRVGCRWPVGRGNVTVTYDRGYDLLGEPYDDPALYLPSSIKLVTMAIAKRILGSGALPVGGFTSETMGQYSYTRADGTQGVFELDDGERSILSRFRDVRVA